MSQSLFLPDGFGDRLRHAVKLLGGVPEASTQLKTGQSTLYTWFKGDSSPTVLKAFEICALTGLRPEWLFTGRGAKMEGDAEPSTPDAGERTRVALFDVRVSAGPGSTAFDKDPTDWMEFPTAWLRERYIGDLPSLQLVRVAGDSQAPDIVDGDLVMISTAQNGLAEGMHVVRLDDNLLVKRLQLGRGRVHLLSANPAYPPVEVDLTEQGNDFAIIGRVLWAIRQLG